MADRTTVCTLPQGLKSARVASTRARRLKQGRPGCGWPPFMGDGAVAITVHVQLDRLELHHPGPGLVDEPQHRKVGIARRQRQVNSGSSMRPHRGAPAGVVKADSSASARPAAIEAYAWRRRRLGSSFNSRFEPTPSPHPQTDFRQSSGATPKLFYEQRSRNRTLLKDKR